MINTKLLYAIIILISVALISAVFCLIGKWYCVQDKDQPGTEEEQLRSIAQEYLSAKCGLSSMDTVKKYIDLENCPADMKNDLIANFRPIHSSESLTIVFSAIEGKRGFVYTLIHDHNDTWNYVPVLYRGQTIIFKKYADGWKINDFVYGWGSFNGVMANSAQVLEIERVMSAENKFKDEDLDGNGRHDFWTGDVAGLYWLTNNDDYLGLISFDCAQADYNPLSIYDSMKGKFPAGFIEKYSIMAMEFDEDGNPYKKTDGTHNEDKFGFLVFSCAKQSDENGVLRPIRPERTLDFTYIYIFNQEGKIYIKNKLSSVKLEELLRWPRPDPITAGWRLLDYRDVYKD